MYLYISSLIVLSHHSSNKQKNKREVIYMSLYFFLFTYCHVSVPHACISSKHYSALQSQTIGYICKFIHKLSCPAYFAVNENIKYDILSVFLLTCYIAMCPYRMHVFQSKTIMPYNSKLLGVFVNLSINCGILHCV